MEVVNPHRLLWYCNRLGHRRAKYNDSVLLALTLDDAADRGLLAEIETIWLDRGYNSSATRKRLTERSIADCVIAKKHKRSSVQLKTNQLMGLPRRWRGQTPGFRTMAS